MGTSVTLARAELGRARAPLGKVGIYLPTRAPASRAIIGVQGARARACAARQPRLQLQLAPMTSFVTSFPRRYRDVI